MKIIFTLISFSILLNSIGQDIWIQRDSIKGPTRANAASFTIGDDGYIVSGYDGFNKKRSSVSYDIDQDDWDQELSLGGLSGDGLNRTSAIGFSAGGYGFVGLGEGDGFIFQDLWMHDKMTDTWTQMADFIGPARTQAVSFSIDNIGYVGSGKDSDLSTLHNDFYKYDQALNSWEQIADFPGTGRMDAVGTAVGGQGYVGLGYDGSSYANDFYQYFPLTDSWVQIANFPGTPRINAVSFGVFPQLYITTGDDGFNYLNDTWEYNYFGDVWTQRADFPGAPRSGASSFVLESRPFVGAGFGAGIYYDDFYEYTVALSNQDFENINVNVYPNPTANKINIQLNGEIQNPKFKLFDISGKEMIDTEPMSNSNGIFELNLSYLNSGTYYIAIYDGNEMRINKAVVLTNN